VIVVDKTEIEKQRSEKQNLVGR